MYEAIEFIEVDEGNGLPNPQPQERKLGTFSEEPDAVEAGRAAKKDFHVSGRTEYAWWVVRKPGAQLASWIADSTNDQEFVLDLRSGQLVRID